MPATPSRIGFITQQYRIVRSGPDSGVVTKYGANARRSDVVPSFFEVEADAQSMSDARKTLLAADRRRFEQTISGEATGIGLAYTSTTPVVTVIDDLRQANHTALVSQIVIDFSRQETRLETWG